MADEARNLKQYKELPDNSTLLLLLFKDNFSE